MRRLAHIAKLPFALPNLDDNISRRADVMSKDTSDGAVLVDMMSGRCWELNRVGAALWAMLATPTTLRRVCDALAARYRVEEAVLQRDVNALADDLMRAGLILAVPGSAERAP